tara:strand:- start:40 stop:288 length:249 start_codon:yes stop_codon:yes gene_type:complete
MDSFYLRTKSYTITEDGFMHNHQASLDSQREEAEINWLFPKDEHDYCSSCDCILRSDEENICCSCEEIEDKDFPYEEDNYEY